MNTCGRAMKRLSLVILVVALGCQLPDVGAAQALAAEVSSAQAKIAQDIRQSSVEAQLEINRNALLAGPGEQIRLKAANVMLFGPWAHGTETAARQIVLEALKQSANSEARMAVCKALSQSRTSERPVKNKQDFIEPLLEILAADESSAGKLAAEASLIFEYEQIAGQLEKIATDSALSAKARANAVYALKLQPDKRAIFKLMELLRRQASSGDEGDKQVAAAVEKALQSLAIPIGKDAETRRQIIDELKRKSKDEFLRDWLIRQEAQMRKLETESQFWQKQYLSSLERLYNQISEDPERGKFLAEHLGSPKVAVKLWSLEKVYQARVGTKSKLPAELDILVDLISDPSSEVRLKTAKLLSLTSELNSTERLLSQLEIEQNDEVKTELFVALGRACHYAFSPNSGINLAAQTRIRTLEWATKYLDQSEPKKSQKGAKVIKKLLEQDGLEPAEVDRYLSVLADRYKRQNDTAEGFLRAELLDAMAGLCAASSAYKSESAKLFKPLFQQALGEKTDSVREAAIDGLIHIDKARALTILRKGFTNDSSVAVRKKLIDLAGDVGSEEDLYWLAEKTETIEKDAAWQGMLKIFKRSDAAVLDKWLSKFDSPNGKIQLSDEQRISLLEIAEKRAAAENKLEMIKDIRHKLAQFYTESGDFERAAEYFGMLYEAADTAEEKEVFLAELLNVYLQWPNIERAKDLIANCLLEKDLDPNSAVVSTIDDYFAAPPAGANLPATLQSLEKIDIPAGSATGARPKWSEQMKRWADRFSRAEDPNLSS